MFKRILRVASSAIAVSVFASMTALASTPAVSNVNKAYYKSNGTYNIVVKAASGLKLGLYVNDKNRTAVKANAKDWATFKGVHLVDSGKLSFTRFTSGSSGKQFEKPINFVRYFTVTNNAVTFSRSAPLAPVTATPTPHAIAPTPVPKPVAAPTPAPTPVAAPTLSCTNGSYTNSVGNTVCSPETVPTAPAGATAQCVDGTYSFSQSRRGTCSYHGGVASWL